VALKSCHKSLSAMNCESKSDQREHSFGRSDNPCLKRQEIVIASSAPLERIGLGVLYK